MSSRGTPYFLAGLCLVISACTSESERPSGPTGDPRGADSDTQGGDDIMGDGDAHTGDPTAGDGPAGDSGAGSGDAVGGDSTGGDDRSGDAGAPADRGTCQDTTDCGGDACVRVPNVSGGWRTCVSPRQPATGCAQPMFDACCDSSECTAGDGGCYEGPLWYCGGAFPQPAHLCVYDECSSDAQCTASPGGLCIPAGAFGEYAAHCTYGGCKVDSDCGSRAGGRCLPFENPCNGRLNQFACTYDDSPCRVDADCTGGGIGQPYCAPGTDGNTTCELFTPPP